MQYFWNTLSLLVIHLKKLKHPAASSKQKSAFPGSAGAETIGLFQVGAPANLAGWCQFFSGCMGWKVSVEFVYIYTYIVSSVEQNR